MSWPQYNFIASYLFIGLVLFFLGILVYFKNPRQIVNRAFLFYCLPVSWWSLFSVLMVTAQSEYWGTFWDRICLIGVVFIPSTFIHFNYVILKKEKKAGKFIYANYLISFFFLLFIFTPLMVKTTVPHQMANYFTVPGPLYLLFVIYFFALSFWGIWCFFKEQFEAKGEHKVQMRYLFWATLLGYSGGGFNYTLSYGIGLPAMVPFGNYAVGLYGLVVAYTITKHRLMDISLVISRTVAEFLTVLFHGAIYLGLVWLYQMYVSGSIDLLFLAGTILYGVIVGQTHQNLRLFFQTTSDKLFLRGRYDYYRALSDASSRVGEKLALPDILKVLYETFYDVVEISNSRVFLPEHFAEIERTSDRYLIYDKENFLPQKEGAEIKIDSPLVKELVVKRGPLHNSSDLVVPCMLEDRLIAMFVLGPKLSEDAYTDEDLRLLEVLANQAAITLDHTRSYEKIKSDLNVAERQLARSQRLASLGTLTAGVTHEIRNPLTVIRAETERLANQDRDLEYLKQHRDLLLRHIDRISGIVQRMLGLAKEKPRQETELNLNEIINSSLELFAISGVLLKKEFQPVPNIKGDAGGLQEIFVNLIQNAIDSMPEGGVITIRTYTEDDKAVAEVSDTGKGIPEEIREKIFDPFYSTRHEGVGLGLSIVYRIVREHGGDIRVDSEEGKGSTFKVSF